MSETLPRRTAEQELEQVRAELRSTGHTVGNPRGVDIDVDIAIDTERERAQRFLERIGGALGMDGSRYDYAQWLIWSRDNEDVVQRAQTLAADRVYLAAEANYWREQHKVLHHRQRKAADVLTGGEAHYFGDTSIGRPPEPPVGTYYADPADGGIVAWTRKADGWHCSYADCRNCPADWGEVIDWRDGLNKFDRHLPGDPVTREEAPF